jgi:hypothetical protein
MASGESKPSEILFAYATPPTLGLKVDEKQTLILKKKKKQIIPNDYKRFFHMYPNPS